jgi:hypothetical protein
VIDVGEGLGEEHIGARVDVGLGALERRVEALAGDRVRTGHNHKAAVSARRHRGLQPVHHLARGHHPLVRPVSAALVLGLLLAACGSVSPIDCVCVCVCVVCMCVWCVRVCGVWCVQVCSCRT